MLSLLPTKRRHSDAPGRHAHGMSPDVTSQSALRERQRRSIYQPWVGRCASYPGFNPAPTTGRALVSPSTSGPPRPNPSAALLPTAGQASRDARSPRPRTTLPQTLPRPALARTDPQRNDSLAIQAFDGADLPTLLLPNETTMKNTKLLQKLLVVGGFVACTAASVVWWHNSRAFAQQVTRPTTGEDQNVVRLSTVKTIQDGGLLDVLVADFEKKFPYRIAVYTGEDVYQQARDGKADLVFSHWGHKAAQAFMQDGLGEWPQAVLSNSAAFIVPLDDPADVATATDPVQAFERIAQSKSRFIVNNIDGVRYFTEVLWNAAGKPDKTGWYIDTGLAKAQAIDAAAKTNAYTIWGATPFLRYQKANNLALKVVPMRDSSMQRLMVSVMVNPAKIPGVNVAGAKAFQAYLLDPATQAMIRAFRIPGIDQPLFWPQGRTNASAALPNSTEVSGGGGGGGGGGRGGGR
jgi:tungstate transport system substrate-binding protein